MLRNFKNTFFAKQRQATASKGFSLRKTMNNKKVAPQIAGQVDFFAGNCKSQYFLLHSLNWVSHGCTNRSDLEMKPKYLTKTDVQLNPNIVRIKIDKRVL